MEQILLYREKLILFLTKYEGILKSIGKFLGGLATFYMVSQMFGYSNFLSRNIMVILLALICVLLPFSMIYLLGNFIIMLQLSVSSLEVLLVYMLAVGLYHLIYQRMFPELRYLVILTPVLYFFHIPALLPLFVGAFIGVAGIPAISMGTFIYYFGLSVQAGNVQIENGTATSQLSNYVTPGSLGDSNFFIYLLAFIFTVLVVIAIRKLQVAYTWYISVGVGGIVYLILTLIGGFMTGNPVNVLSSIGIAVVSVLIVFVLQFLDNVIDYSREETLEFEDDEYYYYVKAIPKNIVKEEDVNITKINDQPGNGFGFKRRRNREN